MVLLFVVLAGFGGWRRGTSGARARSRTRCRGPIRAAHRSPERRVDALRRDQRAQGQRLQQADATNRVLRDELLGIGQRAALLEDSITKLADPDRHGAQALRLDEVELLLTQGQQRLSLSGDLDSARRAYALAAGVLDGVDDPAYLSLRQTLAQERAALDALGIDPKAAALANSTLSAAPFRRRLAGDFCAPASHSWWQRALSRIVEVRPSDRNAIIDAAIALRAPSPCNWNSPWRARRSSAATWRLPRRPGARRWLVQRCAAVRRTRQAAGAAARPRTHTVAPAMPTLGTTLAQMRAMRAST